MFNMLEQCDFLELTVEVLLQFDLSTYKIIDQK